MRILLIEIFLIFSTFFNVAYCDDVSNLIQIINSTLNSLINLKNNDPYIDLTIDEYVNDNGYKLEAHSVTTEDGYILTLHRIPSENSGSSPRPAIVFKSGLMASAWDFLYLGKNKSLAMLFADKGYDIWLINTRGSRYSLNHTKYDSAYNSKEFWDFSFHEKGYYDLAASIDYITNTTGTENVTLIGHSSGTAEGIVLVSTRPEYQKKINLLVLFSPVTYVSHTKSPEILAGDDLLPIILATTKLLRIEGVPYSPLLASLMKNVCSTSSPGQSLCLTLLGEYAGQDSDEFNKTMLSFYFANYPDGSSQKEFHHFAQEVISGEFRPYDYGADNTKHYNSIEPPSYNISAIKTPIAAYYGANDLVATPTDVEKFLKEVPNLVKSKLVDYALFNHIDFIWANDVKSLVYDDVIELVEVYNPIN